MAEPPKDELYGSWKWKGRRTMKRKQYIFVVLCLVLIVKSNSSPIVINVNDSPLSDVTLTYSSSIRLSWNRMNHMYDDFFMIND